MKLFICLELSNIHAFFGSFQSTLERNNCQRESSIATERRESNGKLHIRSLFQVPTLSNNRYHGYTRSRRQKQH